MSIFWLFFSVLSLMVFLSFRQNLIDEKKITKISKDKKKSFCELLNYSTLVAPGIILTSEGTLIAGFFYRGHDVQASTDDQLEYRNRIINEALRSLGENFAVHVDVVRTPSTEYPPEEIRHFPDPITRKIDNNRRDMFEKGVHHESTYALIVTYIPPNLTEAKVFDLMYTTGSEEKKIRPFDKNLIFFKEKLSSLEIGLKPVVQIERLKSYAEKNEFKNIIKSDNLINYINYCLTGQFSSLTLPKVCTHVNSLLGLQPFQHGIIPVFGENFIICVSINGYPAESYPEILANLDKLPWEYRLTHRFVTLPREVAISITKKQQKKWTQKIRGMRDQIMDTNKGMPNDDAQKMAMQAKTAFSEIESGEVAYGLHSCTITLMGTDKEELIERAKLTQQVITGAGFTSSIEDVNTVEAFLGSLPGNVSMNLRQYNISTMVLSDLLPTSSIWTGLETNPNPQFPPNTPPLIYASTQGVTPYRLNLYVGDVGHTLIFGRTGSGKSTLIGLILAQFRAYKNARIYAFDKDYSLYTLTRAIDGAHHYDLAGDSKQLQFSPLKNIDSESDFQWAVDWIVTLVEFQREQKVLPSERQDIVDALNVLRESKEMRSLTQFNIMLQNAELGEAIDVYCSGIIGDLLNSEEDCLELSNFCTFELEHLMKMKKEFVVPVLLYIFRKIEKSLNGDPTFLSLDEGWLILDTDAFRDKLREWLKTLRKRNCSVLFATQSITDTQESSISHILEESCFTKIFLPNSSAKDPASADLYRSLGLNNAELEIISGAKQKQDYYIVQRGQGKRMINFNIDPYTLAFVGVSGEPAKDELENFIKNCGNTDWREEWVKKVA